MTMPALPGLGTTSWHPWATAVHEAAEAVTDGRLTEEALGAAFVAWENVRAHGAVGDGTTDDTTAINAAWTAAAAAGAVLYFPPGYNFVYNGTGLTGANIKLAGAGKLSSQVSLGTGKYLIDDAAAWQTLQVRDLWITGGAGGIRHRYTGSQVVAFYEVSNCYFQNYTGAAISHNSSDMPYWKISGNTFRALNTTSSIGVALPGLTDSCALTDNSFLINRVHVKLGAGGNNAYLRNNDFLRFTAYAGTPRTDVWVVPQTSGVNSGSGMTAISNKFGNENYDAADYKILYADEGTGTYFGDRLPALGADSTGYISNHTFDDNAYHFNTPGGPIVYSTTPNVRGVKVAGVTGGGATEVFKFRTNPTGAVPDMVTNLIGPLRLADENGANPPISIAGGVGRVLDPTGSFEGDSNTANTNLGGASGTGFAKLTTATVPTWTLANATVGAVTDAAGGTDAVRVTGLTGGAEIYNLLAFASLRLGAPLWMEFDLKAVSGSAVDTITAYVKTYDNASWSLRRVLSMPAVAAGWQRYRFLTYARSTANTMIGDFVTNTAGAFDLGRVRIYHAREPVHVDLVLPDSVTTTTAPAAGGAGALPATPAGYVTVYVNGVLRKLPYY